MRSGKIIIKHAPQFNRHLIILKMTFYGTSQIQIPIKNKKKVRTVSSNNKKGTDSEGEYTSHDF